MQFDVYVHCSINYQMNSQVYRICQLFRMYNIFLTLCISSCTQYLSEKHQYQCTFVYIFIYFGLRSITCLMVHVLLVGYSKNLFVVGIWVELWIICLYCSCSMQTRVQCSMVYIALKLIKLKLKTKTKKTYT